MSNDTENTTPQEIIGDEPTGKMLVGLDNNLLLKLFETDSAAERREMLRPVAVAILWDRGEISDTGFSRAADKIFMHLNDKIVEKLGDVNLDEMNPAELEALAEKHGIKETIIAAKKMWEETEVDRKLVRQYIEEKKKLKEEKDASQ